MPSKIPQEAEIDSDDGEEMMPMGAGYPGMPERKEYLWSCDLKGNFSSIIWEEFYCKKDRDRGFSGDRCASDCKMTHFNDPFFLLFRKIPGYLV